MLIKEASLVPRKAIFRVWFRIYKKRGTIFHRIPKLRHRQTPSTRYTVRSHAISNIDFPLSGSGYTTSMSVFDCHILCVKIGDFQFKDKAKTLNVICKKFGLQRSPTQNYEFFLKWQKIPPFLFNFFIFGPSPIALNHAYSMGGRFPNLPEPAPPNYALSERISDREMEGGVAVPIGRD